MHTIVKANKNLWHVIFEVASFNRIIERNLSKNDAMALVNYLNGGSGHEFGRPIEIQGQVHTESGF